MSKSLTIALTDAQYEAICAAAVATHQTPEELIAATIAERLGTNGASKSPIGPAEDPVIQIMRRRGHLVDPRAYPPPPRFPGLPEYGTPEWEAMIQEETERDPEDEVDWSRVNLADFVER